MIIQPFTEKDTSGSNLAFSATRDDGTSGAVWSEKFHLWVKAGFDFASEFVIGEGASFRLHNSGASGGPPKVSFGSEVNSRVCLFESTQRTPGGGVDLKFIRSPASGDYGGTWETRTLQAVSGVSGYCQVNDAVVVNDALLVCGGADPSGVTGGYIWTSTDSGTSWTREYICSFSSNIALNRIDVGPNDTLATVTNSTTDGDAIHYRTLSGTWHSRNGIGFSSIVDVVFAGNFWFFGTGASLQRISHDDLMAGTGTFEAIGAAGTITAMIEFENKLVVACEVDTGWNELWLVEPGIKAQRCIGRDPLVAGQRTTGLAKDGRGRLLLQTPSALAIATRG